MLTIFKRAFRDFGEDEAPVRAAALAYYTVFALPPLLVLLIMAAGIAWDPQDVQRALEFQFASLVGREGAQAIHGMITAADRSRDTNAIKTILGVAGLLFGATGAFFQLQGALNRAWEVKPDPRIGGLKNFIMKRLLSLGMILGIAFLLIVSLALSAILSLAGDRLGGGFPDGVLHVANFAVSFTVVTLLFAAIFKLLPDAVIEWRDVWVGAVVTSLLFVAGKFALGLYLGHSEPGQAFGAASALAVILIWIYYAGMILLFGAEFTQAWAREHGRHVRPEKGAVRLEDAPANRARKKGDARSAATSRRRGLANLPD